jgi:hypothetical protein
MTVGWFDSRPDAEEAETAAIKAEGPKYNKTHLVPRARKKRATPKTCLQIDGHCLRPEPFGCIGESGIGYPCLLSTSA